PASGPHIEQNHEECNAVGGPHIRRVPAHGQKFAHLAASAVNCRSQRASCSRSTISPCSRFNTSQPKHSVKPTIITISGASMSIVIDGLPSFEIGGPWCSVLHHSTE